MGIVMKKKMVLLATALAIISGSALTGPALAADMPVKAIAPPPAPFEPWDFAFGSAIMSDYIFRGVTQSDPSRRWPRISSPATTSTRTCSSI